MIHKSSLELKRYSFQCSSPQNGSADFLFLTYRGSTQKSGLKRAHCRWEESLGLIRHHLASIRDIGAWNGSLGLNEKSFLELKLGQKVSVSLKSTHLALFIGCGWKWHIEIQNCSLELSLIHKSLFRLKNYSFWGYIFSLNLKWLLLIFFWLNRAYCGWKGLIGSPKASFGLNKSHWALKALTIKRVLFHKYVTNHK